MIAAVGPFRQRSASWIFTACVLIMVYLTIVPVCFLIYGALNDRIGEFHLTVKYWVKAYGSAETFALFLNSCLFAAGSAVLSLAVGGVAAWLTARTNTRLKAPIDIANLFGMAVPSIYLAIAWTMLLAPRSGMLNQWLLSVLPLQTAPLNIYSLMGMIWVEGLAGAPFAYLLMVGIFRAEDQTLQEAAKVSGAGHLKVLTSVTLPLTLPGLLSVFIFRFIRGIEAFDIPAVLGLPRRIEVLSTRIFRVVNEEMSYSIANVYALGIMGLAIVAIYLYQMAIQKSYRYATITGRGFRVSKIDLGRWHWIGTSYLVLYFAMIILLPTCVLLWGSLLPYTQLPSAQALTDLTFRNFENLLSKPQVFRAFENTFFVAAATAAICVFMAAVISWLIVRGRSKARYVLDVLAFVPLTIPGIALGVALVWIYLVLPIPVYGTLWILLIGYTTAFLPVSMRFVIPGVVQIHKELEESAYTAGASWFMTFRTIVLPLIIPNVVGAAVYVFMLVFRVLSMAIVVYTPKTLVVPVLIFQQWVEAQQGNEVQALVIITAVVLSPFAILYYWLNKNYGLSGDAPAH